MEPTTEPAKLKAAATYNAAADHFDDGPLAFWDPSGYRWTVEQLDADAAARVRSANLATLRENGVTSFETNVHYAVARKA
jgi:hypothetical protein